MGSGILYSIKIIKVPPLKYYIAWQSESLFCSRRCRFKSLQAEDGVEDLLLVTCVSERGRHIFSAYIFICNLIE